MSEPGAPNPCFGCGAANPQGMRLVFERDDAQKRIRGRFRLGPEYQGAPGMVHGGIIATVLDEAMGKASRFSEVATVTAELTIEYLRPVRIGEEIVVEGYQQERNGRELLHCGEIRNAAGQLLARGRGRFVVINPNSFFKAVSSESKGERT